MDFLNHDYWAFTHRKKSLFILTLTKTNFKNNITAVVTISSETITDLNCHSYKNASVSSESGQTCDNETQADTEKLKIQ